MPFTQPVKPFTVLKSPTLLQVNASVSLYLTLKHACTLIQHMSEAANSFVFVFNMPIDKPQLNAVHS